MKTSTLLWLGAGAAAVYFLSKKTATAAATETATQALQATSSIARGEPVPQQVVVVDPTDYYVPVGWGPSWAGLSNNRGRRGGGGGGGGHGHGHGGHGGGHH